MPVWRQLSSSLHRQDEPMRSTLSTTTSYGRQSLALLWYWGSALDSFADFTSDRTLSQIVNNAASTACDITCGRCPKGQSSTLSSSFAYYKDTSTFPCEVLYYVTGTPMTCRRLSRPSRQRPEYRVNTAQQHWRCPPVELDRSTTVKCRKDRGHVIRHKHSTQPADR